MKLVHAISIIGVLFTAGCTSKPKPVDPLDKFKSDAYSYYGLGSAKPKKYKLKISGKQPSESDQTIAITFKSTTASAAIFEEKDSGVLMGDSTLTLSLDSDGLYVDAITPQVLKSPHFLQLPATLKPGTTWKNRQELDSNGQSVDETLDFKVVGPGSVTTPAGKFDALDVVGVGSGTFSGQKAELREETWYVKDFGIVRQDLSIKMKGATTNMVESLEP